ncbi:MAG TPA: ABC transporter ATP-binding protein [Nanoarchaeota archaeon]|nr:ABC transporter ATP-binding protein [Nanoarchaeota archaeon]
MKNKHGEKIEFRRNLSIYWSIVKRYKWMYLGMLIVSLLIEASYTAERYLFKLITDGGTNFTSKLILASQFIRILSFIGIAFALIVLTRLVSKWLFFQFNVLIETNTIRDLKRHYFNHIIELSHSFHTSHRTGSLISRLTRGGSAMERMTDAIAFNFSPLAFNVIVITGSLIYFDWISAVIVFVTTSALTAYSFIVQQIQQKPNLEANNAEDIEKGNIADIFTNIDSIKYFGKEAIIKHRFEKLSEITRKAYLKAWNLYRWMDTGQSFITAAGVFFLVYSSVTRFIDGSVTLGTLVFIYTTFGSLMGSVYSFVHGIRAFYKSMADFQSLFQYSKIESEIKDKPDAKECPIKEGEIEFKSACFSYGARKIFRCFTLKVPKNKKTALVGHSGSGKSTLVKMLYRLYDVNEGSILIDGKDIKDFRQESLRAEMSIVPQECILFDDTISNNIKFSKPHATHEEVMQALKFAQLDRFVASLPLKENTIVGERGVKLSGGEKQRVSIARALLANKKILVLDEATSSLDSETEMQIQTALAKLMEGRTTIIIAHRLSTIMKADKIVVMNKGGIVQVGTHKELIRKKGEYRKLWNLQKGGYIK